MGFPSSLHDDFRQNISDAVRQAARALDLEDMDEVHDTAALDLTWRMRHHCGTCEVHTTMDIVGPAYEAYIDWLLDQIPEEA